MFFGWGAVLGAESGPHPKNCFAALRNFIDLPTKGEVGKAKRRGIAPAPFANVSSPILDALEVHGLGAALVGFDFEADLLALVQAAKARRLDGRDVHEHVLAAVFRRDETKTLRRV